MNNCDLIESELLLYFLNILFIEKFRHFFLVYIIKFGERWARWVIRFNCLVCETFVDIAFVLWVSRNCCIYIGLTWLFFFAIWQHGKQFWANTLFDAYIIIIIHLILITNMFILIFLNFSILFFLIVLLFLFFISIIESIITCKRINSLNIFRRYVIL
jgi:hypothetical protein